MTPTMPTFNATLHDVLAETRFAYNQLLDSGFTGQDTDLTAASLKVTEMARHEQDRIDALRRQGSLTERLQQSVLDEVAVATGRRMDWPDVPLVVADMIMKLALCGTPLPADEIEMALQIAKNPKRTMKGELKLTNMETGETTVLRATV